MRKLKCHQISGLTVQEVLDDFNERREEFHINDSDIVTVCAFPAAVGTKIATADREVVDPKVEVIIVYWADE